MTSRIGFFVSAAVHSAVAVSAAAYFYAPAQAPAKTEKRLTMSLAMFEKPAETPPPPAPAERIIKPEPKPAPLPKPAAVETPVPKPEPAAEEEINPFSEEEPAEAAPAEPQQAAHSEHAVHHPHAENEKLSYVSQVISAVEKNKFYPNAARRRGLTGEARITMNINDDGSLSGLQVECDHPMLAKAAEDAVRRSCPLPKPGDSVHCPMCLVFKMKFELD